MKRRKWVGFLTGAALLAVGIGGMLSLAALKKPPAEAKTDTQERAIPVETMPATAANVSVTLSGFGEVRSVRTVQIASEVSGTIMQTHPRLLAGEVVPADALLFALDARPFEAALDQAKARIAECDTQLRRLAMEQKNETERLALVKRSEDLAKARFDRSKKLQAQAIGDQTQVDEAERALNDAMGTAQVLERQVALFPIRIEETQQQKLGLEASLRQAELNLSYTTVRAPFDCRIAAVNVEQGQHLSPGQPALIIADDSALEISVKLDAAEARNWLRFTADTAKGEVAWFSALDPVDCEVRWVEQTGAAPWRGKLDRVEQFDPQSRTVSAIVRVSAADACTDDRAPLVAGMFCEARIPGREIAGVYRLPQSALTLDRTVRIARGDRLANVPVDVLRQEDGLMYVRAELTDADRIITTRLVNPVENSLLEFAAAIE